MNDLSAVKTISIHDQEFVVSAPFAAGHVLDEPQAKVLNQVRAENVANNFRKRIKAALEGVAVREGVAVETLDAVRAAFAEYDAKYIFSMPSVGRSSEPIDPVERESLRIAREIVKKKLAEQGRKLKDVDEEKLEAKIAEVAASEKVQKLAKQRVSAMEKVASDGLENLDL